MKKPTSLTITQKKRIAHYISAHPKVTRRQIVQWVKSVESGIGEDICLTQVTKLKQNLEFFLNSPDRDNQKRNRSAKNIELEQLLHQFISENSNRIPSSDSVILKKAEDIAAQLKAKWEAEQKQDTPEYHNLKEMKFSNGWLGNFKKRYGLTRAQRQAAEGMNPPKPTLPTGRKANVANIPASMRVVPPPSAPSSLAASTMSLPGPVVPEIQPLGPPPFLSDSLFNVNDTGLPPGIIPDVSHTDMLKCLKAIEYYIMKHGLPAFDEAPFKILITRLQKEVKAREVNAMQGGPMPPPPMHPFYNTSA